MCYLKWELSFAPGPISFEVQQNENWSDPIIWGIISRVIWIANIAGSELSSLKWKLTRKWKWKGTDKMHQCFLYLLQTFGVGTVVLCFTSFYFIGLIHAVTYFCRNSWYVQSRTPKVTFLCGLYKSTNQMTSVLMVNTKYVMSIRMIAYKTRPSIFL